MRIGVCIKQVPLANEGEMDINTGLIKRSSMTPSMNVYDLSAIEIGLQIREKMEIEVQVEVLTMAPAKGKDIIVQAYAMGVDHGYLISDAAFSGADVLATSYVLASGIHEIGGYDLLICGKQTTDGDTGQVGGAIATWLGKPYLSNVMEIVEVTETTLVAKVWLDDRIFTTKVNLPCCISVLKEIDIPRIPTLPLKLKAKKKEITTLTLEDMPQCKREKTGVQGSPTKVVKIYPTPATPKRDLIEQPAEMVATQILDILGLEKGGLENL